MSAFLDSCQALGIQCIQDSLSADAAVIWSVLWNGRMMANRQVYNHYRGQNKPVIVLDVGTLIRGHTWKVAVNNINAEGYYGHQKNLDWDRPKKLGIQRRHAQLNHGRVLVAGQHKQSLQLQNVDQESWLIQQINLVQQQSDKTIVVRSHPRCRLDRDRFPATVLWQEPKKMVGTYDSFDFDLNLDFDAVINYSSGPGISAAIVGIPPITHRSSLAHPVSIDRVDQPWTVDLDRWLVEISHTEYTVEEIKQGIWAKRLEL